MGFRGCSPGPRHQGASGCPMSSESTAPRITLEKFRVKTKIMRENVRSKKAHAVYKETCKYFGFLTRLEKLSLSEIREQSVRLQTKYNADLADDFPDELAQFVNFSRVALTDPTTPRNLLSLIRERHLQSVFPNVDIALRIYLTLPVSNASGERSFSKLGIIKHRLRTSMCEDRLNNLTLMSIEHDILRQLDFEELIDEFALRKSRKRAF